ncbi:hypothetical protein Tco_0497828 [Tanacetum coccineum]
MEIRLPSPIANQIGPPGFPPIITIKVNQPPGLLQAMAPQTHSQFMKMNTTSSSGTGSLPSNTVTNLKEDLKGITTRSGVAYQGPTIPITSSSKVAERETEVTIGPDASLLITEVPRHSQPRLVQVSLLMLQYEPVVTSQLSSNYDDYDSEPNRRIEMACEGVFLRVLRFLPIDFLLLEEADAFLALEDDPTSPEVDDSYYDSEGDILLLE